VATTSMGNTDKYGDLRRRLVFLLLALVVYRLGAHIPVPGIDPAQLQQLFKGQQGGILNLFNMFSGGALSRFTVFALGIMPYISASIIMQLLTYVLPTLEQIKKEGEAGRRKITQYTRYATLGLALFQSLGIAVALEASAGLVIEPGFGFRMTAMVSLTAGTMFLMWLGEQITERGLGNGISILIFAGIAAGLPNSIGGLLELVRTGAMSILVALIIVVVVAAVTYFVVFVERGQRKILVNYARRQVGNKVYGSVVALAAQAEHGWRHPPHLRVVHHLAAGHRGELVQFGRQHALAQRHRIGFGPGPAGLCAAVRSGHRVFLFLLHGAGVQQP